jgi:hypothetical protein
VVKLSQGRRPLADLPCTPATARNAAGRSALESVTATNLDKLIMAVLTVKESELNRPGFRGGRLV